MDQAPEEDIRRIVSFAHSQGLKLIVGILPLPVEGCGRGVEGLVPDVNRPMATLSRLKRLGGRPEYIALDEPLTYGHFYHGRNACKYSIPEVARRLAITIKQAQNLFPKAEFIDAEVPNLVPLAQWRLLLSEWLDAYKAETSRHLDYMAIDLNWRGGWSQVTADSIDILHGHNAKAVLFLDSVGGNSVTDLSWMESTRRNIDAVEAARLPLDAVWITSWTGHPKRNLPEDDCTALTSLINWYDNHHWPNQ